MSELKKLSDQEQQEASLNEFIARLEKDHAWRMRKFNRIMRIVTVVAVILPFTPVIYYCIKWLLK